MGWNTDILSPKLLRRRYEHADGSTACIHHEHWCPGCEALHQIAVEQPFNNGARWTYDGNAIAPTFSPSVNVDPGFPSQCHYFIRAGHIEYCADSRHSLAGCCVALPDIPAEWLD